MSAWNLIFFSWLTACVATAGSLFFSEIMGYPPCSLCWYQRIFMYPLVLVFLPAVISTDRAVVKFSLPLVVTGWLISVYHNLVYYGVVPETLSPCSQGVSCKAKFVQWLGVIDIPQLSLLAFTLLLITMVLLWRIIQNEK
jgi:disulfide bond formation protein DsbB